MIKQRKSKMRDFLMAMPTDSDQCIEWPFGLNLYGYGQFNIDGEYLAHRASLKMHVGEPPTPKHECAHGCNNRKCVNPNHLRWATCKENHADKKIHGTTQSQNGTRNPSAKLTESQVMEIYRSTEPQRVVASRFGISQENVSMIKTHKRWAHLTKTPNQKTV